MTSSQSSGADQPHRTGAARDHTAADGEAPGASAAVTGAATGAEYGFPAGFWRALERHRPPGLARLSAFRSPLRGPWLTSVFGSILLVTLPFVIVTGLLDWVAYSPRLGQAMPGNVGWLHLPLFDWPTSPSWLFRLTEGVHVGLGFIITPVVLAKLWSVAPKLFAWPPARSPAQLLERLSLLMLVGGILFEIATGLLNIQYDYIFGFSFYTAHYYGAWVFIAGFVVHVGIKLPTMIRSLRSRSLRAELRTSRADTIPEPLDADGLVATNPTAATVSRRGALGLVGGSSLLVAVLSLDQTLGGFTRPFAVLLPRGRSYGDGPTDFQVNRSASAAAITSKDTGAEWRLTLRVGPRPVVLDRSALLAMPQHTVTLPIACVEGWSTTQTWTGVRLRDLAALAGVATPNSAMVRSLERKGSFNAAALQANQIANADSLLALHVNGVDLSLDHGYPARVIVPAIPGVHNTKWVRAIEFRDHLHGETAGPHETLLRGEPAAPARPARVLRVGRLRRHPHRQHRRRLADHPDLVPRRHHRPRPHTVPPLRPRRPITVGRAAGATTAPPPRAAASADSELSPTTAAGHRAAVLAVLPRHHRTRREFVPQRNRPNPATLPGPVAAPHRRHVRPQRPPLRRPPGLHPPTTNRRPRAVGSRQPRPGRRRSLTGLLANAANADSCSHDLDAIRPAWCRCNRG